MPAPTVLAFDFNGQHLRFPVYEIEPGTSPFTNRRLRKLETIVTLSPQDAALVTEFLRTAPATDAEGSMWSGHLDRESYTNTGPHDLTITWTESEHLQAETVDFEGLSLRPIATKYEEDVNEDSSLVITFQAVLSEKETDRLRSLLPTRGSDVRYWPVIRMGVSNEPRSMRLGRVLWQPLDDGNVGHKITLVDEAFDTSDISNALAGLAGEPQVGNLVHQVSALLVQFDTLVAEVEAAGVMSPEASQRVRASAEVLGYTRSHIFFEVADLSRW